jgi:hypothetical protein
MTTLSNKTSSKNKYVILMETDEDSCESWYYFLKYNNNEGNIDILHKQITKINPSTLIEGCTVFDMDISHTVSEETAKEMCSIELNSVTFHRKFDGELSKINFKFEKHDDDEDMVIKVHEMIGYGNIDKYITDEDIPESNAEYNEMSDEYSLPSSHDSDDNESDTSLEFLEQNIPSKLKL